MREDGQGEASHREPGGVAPGQQGQLVELLVFLFLIVPSMVLSWFAFPRATMGFALVAVSTIVRDLSLVSLILFFLWRNGESVERIGWTFRNGWTDVGLGVGLLILVTVAFGVIASILQALGVSLPSPQLPSFLIPHGPAEIALAVLLVAVVAVAEETIFRGYLLLRLTAVTRSVALAVILSAVIFSLGHVYEGAAGVVTVGTLGVVFALVYLWRKSLVAPIVMHFLQNLVSIILVPLFLTR